MHYSFNDFLMISNILDFLTSFLLLIHAFYSQDVFLGSQNDVLEFYSNFTSPDFIDNVDQASG